jgi:hypothetical protein
MFKFFKKILLTFQKRLLYLHRKISWVMLALIKSFMRGLLPKIHGGGYNRFIINQLCGFYA